MKYKDTEQVNQEKTTLGKRGPACGEKAPEVGLLGTNAKSSATFQSLEPINKGLDSNYAHTVHTHVDYETGEVIPFKKNKFGDLVENVSTDKILVERYLLQCSARHLMPHSRTAKCTRLQQRYKDEVGLSKSKEFNTVSYIGLQTCGSPWACASCSARISERRKTEVVTALNKHLSTGATTYFVTFTFSHSKNEDLLLLRKQQEQALRILRASYGYRKYKKIVGYSGLIRALEVTWGMSNGWHPHTHEIVFADKKVSFSAIKNLLFPEWKKACKKAGLAAPSFRRGVDVRGGDKAATYVAKYGDELTKGHSKKATGDRFSPFDLLRSYHYDKNKLHGAKFVEFAEAMQGSRQLYWTNGLKDKFGINEKTDQDLVEETETDDYYMGAIPHLQWRSIVKYKHVATVKIIGRDHGLESVLAFANSIFQEYVSSGDMQKDDERIAKNREKYKKHVKPEFNDHLSKNHEPKVDIFEKLNKEIKANEVRKSSPVLRELDSFVFNLKSKISRKEQQEEFIRQRYSKKKAIKTFKERY